MMGKSAFWAGDTSTSGLYFDNNFSQITADFSDGGFKKVTNWPSSSAI